MISESTNTELSKKITAQITALHDVNICRITDDLQKLFSDRPEGEETVEVPVSAKTTIVFDGQKFAYNTELSWSKAQKRTDKSEPETFDPDQPDMFDKDAPINKNGKLNGMKICRSYAKEVGVKE